MPKCPLAVAFYERLQGLPTTRSGIIRFPEVFMSLCSKYRMKKRLCWKVLFLMRDMRLIEVVAGHGVKINKTH
jgi:hypothetical protein